MHVDLRQGEIRSQTQCPVGDIVAHTNGHGVLLKPIGDRPQPGCDGLYKEIRRLR